MSSAFETLASFIGSTSSQSSSTPVDKSSTSSAEYAMQRESARKRLYQGIEVRNRRYRFKEYKRCFVASEAVDFMVQSGWAKTREEAVTIGQGLQKDFALFQHVVEPERHLFSDKYLFFKFNDFSDHTNSIASHDGDDEHIDDQISPGTKGRIYITESLMTSAKKTGLRSVGHLLKENMNLKYNMKYDTEGFHADNAVDYMVTVGLATSRSDAVTIGLALQGVGGFIQNCARRMEPFADSRTFFVFSQQQDAFFMSSISSSSASSTFTTSSSWKKDLEEAGEFFRKNIKLANHTYRLKTYKNTFTGKEAVDLFMASGITSSRQDAVLLGRALMVEFNLFGHVVNEHEFEDSELFYVLGRHH